MTSTTDRKVQRAGREAQTPTECICIMHIYSINHTCAGRQAHKNAPHLPRYQHAASPDKLGCMRGCQFLTLQLSVTFLSELHVVSHGDKENWKEPTCHTQTHTLSLSLPLPLPILSLPTGYCRSRSQRHMLHEFRSCVVIAEEFKQYSPTTSMVWLWMKQRSVVSDWQYVCVFHIPSAGLWRWLSKTT